jgi:hypothetical protein
MHNKLIAIIDDKNSLPRQFIYPLGQKTVTLLGTPSPNGCRKNYTVADHDFNYLSISEDETQLRLYNLFLNDNAHPELCNVGLGKSLITYFWNKAREIHKAFVLSNTRNYLVLYLAQQINPDSQYAVCKKSGQPAVFTRFQPREWLNQSNDLEVTFFGPHYAPQHLKPPYQLDAQQRFIMPGLEPQQRIAGIYLNQFEYFDIYLH